MELLEQGQILCIRVICAPRQLTSRLSRSTPSSTSPFPSPQSRVPCSHRSCSMVVFSGGFGHVYPRQCVSTEVLKQGSQMAQVLSFWKDVIMCLFMYIHVTHSIFFFFIFWQMPWPQIVWSDSLCNGRTGHRVLRSSVPHQPVQDPAGQPRAWPQTWPPPGCTC